jgi:hypothetical protein
MAMATYKDQLRELFHEHEQHIGRPSTLPAALKWGLETGRIVEPHVDPLTVLIKDMRDALRDETRVDAQGREYRVNAAITFTRNGGMQESLWGSVDLQTTPRDFVAEHFAQRRKGIVDDCVKLKTDVDHYNGAHRDMEQLPLILDFNDDVAEREAARAAAREKKDAA